MKRIIPAGSLFFSICLLVASVGCKSDGGGGNPGAVPPPVPSGVLATDGDYKDRVDITWGAVDGADSYVIYKSIDNKDQFRAIASGVAESSYTDTKVTPNRNYFYRVAAANGGAWSQPSADDLGYAHEGPPPAPVASATKNVKGKIVVTWNQTPQTDSYRVLRATKLTGTYMEMAAGLAVLTYEDATPARDTKYYYRVIGVSAVEGEGEAGEPVDGLSLQDVPGVPANIAATNGTFQNKVEITWDATPLAATYRVYRAPDNGGSAGVYTMLTENLTTSYFEDTTGDIDAIYYYRVSAVSSGGESEKSAETTGKRQTGAAVQLVAPANVVASNGAYDSITVSWNEVTDAVGYSVYRSTTLDGVYGLVAGADKIGTISFIDTPPTLVDHYFYKVTSWSSGYSAESKKSLAAEGFAMPQLPAIPGDVAASDTRQDAKIVITWTASARAETYKVYRSDTSDGTYNLIASGLTELTGTDTAIIVGKQYYYKVASVNVSGESVSAHETGNTVLAVPTGLDVSRSGDNMTLTWNAVIGAEGYVIQYAMTLGGGTPSSGDWQDLVTVSPPTLTYTHSNTQSARSHHYRIKAIANSGNTSSAYSARVTEYNP